MAKPAYREWTGRRSSRLLGTARALGLLEERRRPRKALEPALGFVLRVVHALPWATLEVTLLIPAAGESLLTSDHYELRRRLADDRCRDRRWSEFSLAVEDAVLAAHTNGEMNFESALRAIRRHSRAFNSEVIFLTSFLLRLRAQLLDSDRRASARSKARKKQPPIPNWVKVVAVTLLRILDRENPGQLAPGHYTAWTSPTLQAALDWLVTLGIFDAETLITPKTLYVWFTAAGHVAASRRSA